VIEPRPDTIRVEGDVEALCREIESGLACRGWLRVLWKFAEWDGPFDLAVGSSSCTAEETLLPLDHE
jgi:hypothetical protein